MLVIAGSRKSLPAGSSTKGLRPTLQMRKSISERLPIEDLEIGSFKGGSGVNQG